MECGRILQIMLVAVLSVLEHTRCQYVPDSPCPNVFKYERDFSGGWHGIITVPNPLPFLAINIRVSMYVADRVPSNSKAKLTLVNKNAWQNLAAGDNNPVPYRLDFPLPSPLPTIKDITVNDEVICTGTKPSASILTTLTLQHAIYNDRCSSSSLQCPFNIQGSGGKPRPSNNNQLPQSQFSPVQQRPPETPGYIPNQDVTSGTVSPCPEYFSYQLDSNGNWYGLITIPNPYPVVAINLRVSIYLTEFVPRGSKGGLQLVNDLRDEWRRMRTGEKYSVPYRLTLPVQSPLAIVKSITANNQLLCTGSKPDSSRLQTFSFQHDIFHEKCSSSSLNCPYNTVETDYPIRPQQPPPTLPPPPPTKPRPPSTQPQPQPQTPPPLIQPPTTQPRPRPQPIPQPDPPTGSGYQCGKPTVRTNPLIFYGQPTVRGQWPWHAAIYHLERFGTRKYICGGSFIGTRSILTAAHCVTSNGRPLDSKEFLIQLGRYDLTVRGEEGMQELDVNDVFVHREYNSTKLYADLAVLILTSTVSYTEFVRPVCLWTEPDIRLDAVVKREGVVVGWGLDENNKTAEMLKMVKMPIVDQQTCLWSNPTFFSQFTSETTLCAGFRNGSSVCNGDSGSGLVLPQKQSDGSTTWMIRGIVSNSRPRETNSKLCDTRNYIIFTDAAQYVNWISEIYI